MKSKKSSRKATTREIESVVTKTGSGAHVIVPKTWIDHRVRVTLLD